MSEEKKKNQPFSNISEHRPSMCPFLKESESESYSAMSDSLQPHGLYSPWNSPGQNTGVGNHTLLQRIFPTQGSSPGLLHCRQILCQLSHQGSPRRLEWVAYPFSSGSSWPRNQTGVSCIAGFYQLSYQLSYQASPFGGSKMGWCKSNWGFRSWILNDYN